MSDKVFKIKVRKETPRISYVCDFVFGGRNLKYELTQSGDSADFDYASEQCSDLLYTDAIVTEWPSFNEIKKVFEFGGKPDYLASIFYVLTCMEEYGDVQKDHHGRFTANQSILKKYGLLQKAVCDCWAEEILRECGVKEFSAPNFQMQPTFDIDNAYAYKYKVGVRRTLSILRDRIQANKDRLRERRSVDQGGQDPYDTYQTICIIAEDFPETMLFWLVASKGKYDRNLDISHPQHQLLIQRMVDNAEVGIHPSYASFCDIRAVETEKETLSNIVGEVKRSRQHFLRFTVPESYKTLIAAGIEHDYTMGFADDIGFRVGTARVFPWFDLSSNTKTELMIHPFVYMDGTLNEYLKLSPQQAKEKVKELYDEVKRYGGVFCFIWHNETIGEYKHWKGWKSVLEYTLSLYHE
ncbi:MAG: polysaccharide deacetylase family protein [bacterium]|nr:polysaccharide deacetylase family protein [bacterium]